MKILELITGLGGGGAEQVVVDLATRLDRSRFEVWVASIYDVAGSQGFHVERLRDAGVRVISLGVRRKWHLERALALTKILRETPPDILHCHLFHANVLGRWIGPRAGVRRIVSTVHIAERRWRPWRFALERRLDPRGLATVCVSNAVRDFQMSRTHLPADRFVVIPNGIDTARFARPTRPRDAVRAAIGVPADAKLIGAVGRLDPQKGFRYLIDAFGRLAGRPDRWLAIAGDGPEAALLRSLAARSPGAQRIVFLGRRTDIPDLLHAFDVFAMPSIYEGFGLALVEAMAAGVPVVAASVDSLPEVLAAGDASGAVGRLVPPRDPAALAAQIADALANPSPQIIDRARDRARTEYDVSQMIDRYAAFYEETMSKSQP